jgi:hypothetical protein
MSSSVPYNDLPGAATPQAEDPVMRIVEDLPLSVVGTLLGGRQPIAGESLTVTLQYDVTMAHADGVRGNITRVQIQEGGMATPSQVAPSDMPPPPDPAQADG